MSRLYTGGAEWNDPTADGVGAVAGNYVTSPVRTGSRAWSTAATQAVQVTFTQVLGTTYFFRVFFQLSALPSTATAFFGMISGGYTVKLNTNGTLQLQFGSTAIGSPSAAVALNTWYRGELSFNIGAGSSDDSAEFRLDSATIASESAQTRSTTTAAKVFFGDGDSVGTSMQAYWDDVALNDNGGANQNSWAGEGKVVLLLPISDNAVGTGWTLGTGTATGGNAFGSLDNTPPTGVADLAVGSDPKQIRNATANANTNYDANLTTYATAGIGILDRIQVLVPMVATAAPVTTSSKQGTVGIVSNPTIANIALGAGGTAGAFWSGVAGGAYPTGWKWSFGTTTYASAFTRGTSPVMRITQVTSSTRIAVVCAMGMYVDYVPDVGQGIVGDQENLQHFRQIAIKRSAFY